MATDESKIIIKMEAEVGRLQKDLDRANKRIGRFEKQTSRSVKAVKTQLRGLGPAFKVAIGALTLRQAARLSDTYTEINSRLKLVTGSTDALANAQRGVFDVAQRTRQSFSATAELYQRLAQSSDVLRNNQGQLLQVTDTVNKAIAVSGASAVAAEAAITQLGQGLAAGALRGEEFNSVVEQTPRLAKALADGLGVGIGELREMAQEGQLTSDIVIRALTQQADAIDREFQDVGATIGQAFQVLENTFVQIIGGAAEASGAQRGVTDAIMEFSEALNDPEIVQGINTIATAAVDAFRTLTEFIADTTNAVKFLAEELAAAFSGPAADDIVRIEDRIEALQGKISQLQTGVANTNAPDEQRFFQNQIREAQEELEKLITLRENYYDNNTGLPSPASTPVVESRDTYATSPSSGIIELPTKANKSLESAIANLKEQVALYGDVGKAAEIRYKLENGLLGDVSEAQRSLLITQAEKFDALEMEADLVREVESLRLSALDEEGRQIQELQGQYQQLAEAVQAGVLSQESAAQIAAGLAKNTEDVEEASDEMSKFADQAARNMQDAFADFLFDPFDQGLSGMLESFGRTLQRMAAEAAAAQIFSSLGGAAAASGNPVLAGIGELFTGGGRARGGPITPGVGYTVGENGPELFMPNVAGTVIPNDSLSGGNTEIGNITMSFPGVQNATEARRASGAAGRELARTLDASRRYN